MHTKWIEQKKNRKQQQPWTRIYIAHDWAKRFNKMGNRRGKKKNELKFELKEAGEIDEEMIRQAACTREDNSKRFNVNEWIASTFRLCNAKKSLNHGFQPILNSSHSHQRVIGARFFFPHHFDFGVVGFLSLSSRHRSEYDICGFSIASDLIRLHWKAFSVQWTLDDEWN